MNIKSEILRALYNKPPKSELVYEEYTNNTLNSTCNNMLYLCISYINGLYYHSIQNYKLSIGHYTNFIEKVNLDEKYKFMKNMEISNLILREDKIKMYKIKSSFKFDYIDWDDKEWINNLLIYLYVCSVEEIYFIDIEIQLQQQKSKINKFNKKEGNKSDNQFDISHIRPKDILKTRIRPKYTLEEYGQMVADKIALMNSENKEDLRELGKYGIKEEVEQVEEVKTLDELREQDNRKDTWHIDRGNTDNMG